jgi:hypothetical protein
MATVARAIAATMPASLRVLVMRAPLSGLSTLTA